MRRKWILIVLAVALPLRAQFGVGAALTAAHITEPAGNAIASAWIYGPTFNLQYDRGRRISAGLDLRVSLLNGSGLATRSIVLGPRIAVAIPTLHSRIYGEVLIGVMDNRPSANSLRTGHVDGTLAVGLARTVLPHVDWRVLEFAYADAGPFFGLDSRKQLSTGLIARF